MKIFGGCVKTTAQSNEVIVKIHPKHDFTGKLRQGSVIQKVRDYVAWQKAVRKALMDGVSPPDMPNWLGPVSINLDLTTACNYRCDHCIDWEILNSGIKYRHEKLLASLGQLIERGLSSVILIGGGEPTLYPGFGDIVSFLKEKAVQVAVVSNGSRNKKIFDVAELFTEKDWVRLSLDAGTNDTFQRMHKPVKNVTLEEICSGVSDIRVKNQKLQIGFSFIVTWQGAKGGNDVNIVSNVHEIFRAAKLARDSGFSYFSAKTFLRRSKEGAEIMDTGTMADFENTITRIREAVNRAKELETDSFRIVESTNLRLLENGSWQDFTRQPKTCHMQALRQVLSPIGLFNCPAHRGEKKALIASADGYGNAESTAKTQKAAALMLRSFNAAHECREVTCLYAPTNWWLEKAVCGELDVEDLEDGTDREDFFL